MKIQLRYVVLIAGFTFLFGNTAQEKLVIDIERSLMAPCCWSGTVYDHGHSQMEKEIQTMVESGQPKNEIMDHYVKQYGERILAIPVAQGFNVMAWIAPIFIGIAGLIFLGLYLRSPKESTLSLTKTDENIPFSDVIEKELKDLD